jgi:predicted metal-binding membrane protein
MSTSSATAGPETLTRGEALLRAALRRDRLVVAAALALVVVLAWIWLLLGAGMEMSALEMTRMAGMDGWLMQPAVWTPAYVLLMFAMWWAMMLAMMLPSAAPTLLLFARINRGQGQGAPLVPTGVFALGYLLVWGGFSALAVVLQWVLEEAKLLSPMLETTDRWLGVAILVAAGLWQLTPLKARCLGQCRSPLAFLMTRWRPGRGGALRMGLEHGLFCLGCCWFLMALLFFGGVMNLFWIAGLALYVLLEKTLPLGHWLGRAVGLALIGAGAALAVA